MDAKKRQQILLAVLGVLLVVAAYIQWPRATGGQPGQTARQAAVTRAAGGAVTATTEAPDVHLEALADERPIPGGNQRNLFKFKPKYVPPPPAPSLPPQASVPTGLPPPPPVPPIPLKFIGLLEAAGPQRIAILSDGRGAPMYGKEGEAVLGQYKILRIGAESIELDILDGRGRQTIRLSGS